MSNNRQFFETHEIRHGRAQVGALNMHYLECGKGPTVVLLHGWPQYSLQWKGVMAALKGQYRLIAPDLRGAGGTSVPRDGYDKATMARDVLGLIDQLAVQQFGLVGYDLGAGVAYDLAARQGGRVSKAVFMEFGLPGFGYESLLTPTPQMDSGSNWHLSFFTQPDVAEHFMRGKERELLSWFFWHISHNPTPISAEDFDCYLNAMLRPGALRAGIEYYANVWKDSESNRRLAERKLAMPIMVVGGASSAGNYLKPMWQPVAESVQSIVIDEAGHWLADEQPEAVARELARFLGDLRA